MTVSSQQNSVQYSGNGVTTVFAVPFYFLENGHLNLNLIDVATGAPTLLLEGPDYSVVGAGALSGGSVTLTIAPPVGSSLLIRRIVPVTQETDYVSNDPFPAESHERALDKLTMIAQQTTADAENSLKKTIAGDRWDAEGLRIINVANPIDPQDGATKLSVEQYVGSILLTGQGPVNNAANVLYVGVDLVPRTVQDMSNQSDPLKGAALIARADRHFDSLVSLVGLVARYPFDTVSTASYWPGWAATIVGPTGGGRYVWDASRLKADHNAGTVISPTVPWDGTEATFAAYIAKTGETSPGGTGCFVLQGTPGVFYVDQFGAKNDAVSNTPNDAMIQPLLNFVESAAGGGFGGQVVFSRGNYKFNVGFFIRDRTTIRGQGTKATVLNFAGFTGGDAIKLGPTGPTHPTRPAGEHVFACRIEDMDISGGGTYKGSNRAMVYTDGAHEHSGLFRYIIRDFVSYGIHYNTGNGGPAHFQIHSGEMLAHDSAPTLGSKIGIVCNAGGALIDLRDYTIMGGATNKLANAVLMTKDNLIASVGHVELSNVGVTLAQADASNPRVNVINGLTGNLTVTPGGLLDIASAFQGSVSAQGVINKSLAGTGLISIINRANGGEQFLDQAVASYTYPKQNGEAEHNNFATGLSGTAAITRQSGRPVSFLRTGAGAYQYTFTTALPNANYTVQATARIAGADVGTSVTINSASQFVVSTRNQAGAVTDADQIFVTVYRN